MHYANFLFAAYNIAYTYLDYMYKHLLILVRYYSSSYIVVFTFLFRGIFAEMLSGETAPLHHPGSPSRGINEERTEPERSETWWWWWWCECL